ncbi:Demethylmenaquinone methyltransferase [Acaryochloris thomasi RCC1774]|uniref:Demethylmenaquinone methyltransferase n=1 Tax=Acaryochloris thomasi RCC1774 TaxID=1764569 RepID=A0A2W1JLH8_9CYAN|nr:class I SAM-dependent methyltransferase [Acaryochloris thomasi]PZD71762.1 Demethylmenaquinone methyltransferase [Acaryochloris thomasi RCC1774]
MQTLPFLPFDLPFATPLTKLAYQTFSQSKNVFGIAHREWNSRVRQAVDPPRQQKVSKIDDQMLAMLQKRFDQLLESDWDDAQQGIYPTALLFDNPWDEFFRFYPAVWLDAPQTWRRYNQRRYQEFSEAVDTAGYPKYYLQNFHHQSDGYLSDDSANLYDLQVELLFGGTADAMRRRILAPIRQGLTRFNDVLPQHQRIIDVACGTGRTLKMLRAAFPQASLYGTDLSPAYLRKANQLLSQDRGELPQLLQANAEALPYQDNYFHMVSSVFLFHELPATVRRTIINECFRIAQPNGTLVICDSVQVSDSPEMETFMKNFPAVFHEPYYRHYSTDDLEGRLRQAGFTDIQTEVHFMSKYWIARKPV